MEEIINSVMQTPSNTNPNVLRSQLQGMASSSGGVLVVHDNDGTLDKTWQEIRDAPFVVIKIPYDEIYISTVYVYQTGYYVDGDVSNYDVATSATQIYTTSSEDGYPVADLSGDVRNTLD